MSRKRHPNKEIEAALQYAEFHGWQYKASGGSGHAWGRFLCPLRIREGCMMSIWSTPRNAYAHAEQIKKHVDRCPHS